MGVIYCRRCGRKIGFVRTVNGKSMPVESDALYVFPGERGSMEVITQGGRLIRAFPAERDDPAAIRAYVPHWKNCVGAREIKREQQAKAVKRKPEPVMRKPARDNAQQLALF